MDQTSAINIIIIKANFVITATRHTQLVPVLRER